MNEPRKIKVIEPFLTFLVVGLAIFYAINVFNTGNLVWFRNNATLEIPDRIVIYDHGQEIVLLPGHDNFNELANASVNALSKFNNTDLVPIGLSEQTLSDYETKSVVMILHYNRPVQINSIARIGEPTQLLIPIEGRHASGNYVFLGTRGEWLAGALRMADPSPLYLALETMGIVVASVQPAG